LAGRGPVEAGDHPLRRSRLAHQETRKSCSDWFPSPAPPSPPPRYGSGSEGAKTRSAAQTRAQTAAAHAAHPTMKSPYVSGLKPSRYRSPPPFLVRSKEIRQKKTGEPYLSLLLGDCTGQVDAKMWDNVDQVIETFDRDDFVKSRGWSRIFQNRPADHHPQRAEDGRERDRTRRLLPLLAPRPGGDVDGTARNGPPPSAILT